MSSAARLDVRVTGYSESGGHTVYHIVVTQNSALPSVFETHHRFSDFHALHASLQPTLVPHLSANFPVSKSVFGGESVKKERVSKLQDYLRNIVSFIPPHAPLPTPLADFLGVPSTPPSSKEVMQQSLNQQVAETLPTTLPLAAAEAETTAPPTISAAAAFGIPSDEELAAGVLTKLPEPAASPASKHFEKIVLRRFWVAGRIIPSNFFLLISFWGYVYNKYSLVLA